MKILERMLGRKVEREPPRIHRDFKKYQDGWWFNREWPMGTPQVKLAFAFDDPIVLNGCPFVGKIAPNTEGRNKFFGIIFAMREGAEALKKWSAERNVADVRLLTYGSKVIENISYQNSHNQLRSQGKQFLISV